MAGARSLLGLLTSLPGRRDDAIAVVNGLFGDALDERDSPLATPMTVRAGAVVLPLERGDAAAPRWPRRFPMPPHGSACSSMV